jgi:AGZA family xanthine/uracil permease-like MFS transporter
MLSYVVIKILGGKAKDVSPVMYVIAVLFLIKIILS